MTFERCDKPECHARGLSRRALVCGTAATAGLLLAPAVRADPSFPSRPVRIVVTFGPGGVGDVTMRVLAQKLSERLGQQFIIDNRPGAGGIVALSGVSAAPADGYTLFQTGNSITIARSLMRKLPYDLLRDFTSISLVATFDVLLVTRADSHLKSVSDVIEAGRKQPDRMMFGTIARGSTQNLTAELFNSVANLKVPIVTHRTSPNLVTELLRGEIDVGFEYFAGVNSAVEDKQLTVLATSGDKRSRLLPDVPTVQEAGLPGLVVTAWTGLSAPVGTPAEIVDVLSKAIIEAMRQPDVQERAKLLGVEAAGTTPEQMNDRVRQDIDKWAAVIEKAGIAPQ